MHPDTIARISRLDLRARQVVEGFITGMHRSPFFGHSVEFVQHRDYTPGDDIRHLDWKVWSKTDKYYIKQFEEETNLRCTLVVDVSNSMRYGRGSLDKYNYGCTIAACLGYMLLRQQDACGCITFDEDVRHIVPARSQHTHIDAIIKAMDVSRPRDKTDIEKILRRVAEKAASRSMIVLVSDLLVDREALFRGLEMLRHGRHDVLVFHVMDEDELKFPFAGTTRFEGMEELEQLLCDPRALRDGYLEALEEYLVEVRRGCARKAIDYMLVSTNEYLDAVLSKFLHHRMAMFKSAAKARI
ncbi:MAG: DUF58 domain-containing protein [Planctomycetes bacterium]|nr:DUF58 domain-containing protein [Planctomycetota bacterium]